MKKIYPKFSHTTDIGVQENRTYKDSLFRKIFGSECNKKYLLSLYNAISGKNYTNLDDLTLITMDDVLYVSMKNDLSFLIHDEINLYEHQSTINQNMPVRGFLYMAKLWQTWIAENQQNIYRRKLVKLPTPLYVVFYNGKEPMEDKILLKLSDAFLHPPREGVYEWTAIVYNINAGCNKALMDACLALREYADFVQMVRENCLVENNAYTAIQKAMNTAITKNYLDGFFQKEKEMIFMTTLYGIDKDIYERDLREDAKEEGLLEGMRKGRYEIILQLLANYSEKQVCEMIHTKPEEIEAAKKYNAKKDEA